MGQPLSLKETYISFEIKLPVRTKGAPLISSGAL